MDRLEVFNRNAVRPDHTLLPPPPPRPRGPGSFKREGSYGNRRRADAGIGRERSQGAGKHMGSRWRIARGDEHQ